MVLLQPLGPHLPFPRHDYLPLLFSVMVPHHSHLTSPFPKLSHFYPEAGCSILLPASSHLPDHMASQTCRLHIHKSAHLWYTVNLFFGRDCSLVPDGTLSHKALHVVIQHTCIWFTGLWAHDRSIMYNKPYYCTHAHVFSKSSPVMWLRGSCKHTTCIHTD